jgi:hypothetical protein
MAQEDKLKREIDLIGKLLARLLSTITGSKDSLELEEAIKLVEHTLRDQIELDFMGLLHSSFEDFKKKIHVKSEEGLIISTLHYEYIADIFSHLADLKHVEDDRKEIYKKVLYLYEECTKRSLDYSLDRHFKIEKIKRILNS